MIEFRIRRIDSERDIPLLNESILRLPPGRRRKVLSYHKAIDRVQSVVAYELLVELLGEYYGLPADRISMEYDLRGKPRIAGRDDIFLSLSHCPRAVMAVVADVPVGCDIEIIDRCDDTHILVPDLCFSDSEKRRLSQADDACLEFTKIWTMKEACFKLDNMIDIDTLDTAALTDISIVHRITPDYVATLAKRSEALWR